VGLHLDLSETARDVRAVVAGSHPARSQTTKTRVLGPDAWRGKVTRGSSRHATPRECGGPIRTKSGFPSQRRSASTPIRHDVFLIHGGFRVPAVASIGHERGHRHRDRWEGGLRLPSRRGHGSAPLRSHWNSRLFPQDGEVASCFEVAAFLRRKVARRGEGDGLPSKSAANDNWARAFSVSLVPLCFFAGWAVASLGLERTSGFIRRLLNYLLLQSLSY
jgi:hypothetical protein